MNNEDKTIEEYQFGSEELKEQLKVEETDFAKFEIGVPVNIEVLSSYRHEQRE